MDAHGIWPLDQEKRRKMLMSWRKDALVDLVMDLNDALNGKNPPHGGDGSIADDRSKEWHRQYRRALSMHYRGHK